MNSRMPRWIAGGMLAILALAVAPAAADSPRISGEDVATTKGVRPVTVVEGLNRPWGMAWLPDGRLLITERDGRLRLVVDGVLQRDPVAGVPEVFAEGQGGLLDVAIHPRFAENRFVYLTLAAGDVDANRTELVRGTLNGNRLDDVRVLFAANKTKTGRQHFGSRLVWLPDGTLLMSIGDGGNPPLSIDGRLSRWQAQDLKSHLGKTVRLNDDGSIPADNPFVGRDDADPAIWSYGHRNIQGMTLDTATGRVWASEHGSRGGDEVNIIERGRNYGWPAASYSQEYTSDAYVAPDRSRPGMVDARLVWTPSIAPSGLAAYGGDRYPGWHSDLFAGGLVSTDVRHIHLDAAGTVLAEESIAVGDRVRDVRQGPDGYLYILTDEEDGRLIRLEPSR